MTSNATQNTCQIEARTVRTALTAFNARPSGYGQLVNSLLATTPKPDRVAVAFSGPTTPPTMAWGSTCDAVSGGNPPCGAPAAQPSAARNANNNDVTCPTVPPNGGGVGGVGNGGGNG